MEYYYFCHFGTLSLFPFIPWNIKVRVRVQVVKEILAVRLSQSARKIQKQRSRNAGIST